MARALWPFGCPMSRSEQSAVEVNGVTHRYGAVTAVDDVSLRMSPGTATAFVGPDGVGKSTLLGLIAGVRRLQSGTIHTLGGDMASRRHRDRVSPRIAYMPQGLGRNLYPSLSVFENIDFFGRLFGLTRAERRARIDRLLRATGLHPFPGPAGRQALGRDEAEALAVLRADPRSRSPHPRRADHGHRSALAPAVLDADRRDQGGAPGHDGAGVHRLHGRGGALRPAGRDRCRARAGGRSDGRDSCQRVGADSLEEAYALLQGGEPRRRARPSSCRRDRRTTARRRSSPTGLTRRFGDFTAVDHVSFSIERGEIFGFLGSNGCGKTTTMKMLTGLLGMTEGSAQLLGRPVEAADLETRMRVGYMSQSFSLYEELTVRANLELHARLYRVPAAEIAHRVAEALDQFGLAEVAGQAPPSLPLGIRQRLQLAVACLHRPEVLILDEPTSGVDPAARDMFWRLLGDLSRRDGVTIFVSTHFMNEAERCDRISLMHAGRVLAIGTPQEIRATQGRCDAGGCLHRPPRGGGGRRRRRRRRLPGRSRVRSKPRNCDQPVRAAR